jgi:hypothetical protein
MPNGSATVILIMHSIVNPSQEISHNIASKMAGNDERHKNTGRSREKPTFIRLIRITSRLRIYRSIRVVGRVSSGFGMVCRVSTRQQGSGDICSSSRSGFSFLLSLLPR